MAPRTYAPLCSIPLLVGVFVFVSADQKIIPAESGQKNVTLPCRAPNNNIIIVIEWSRADLGKKYVLLFRDKQLNPDQQHPSFKNRVDLQDRQMKDGDVSLILKDVTINDTGTYECRVVQRGAKRRKRGVLDDKPVSIIYLRVGPPGQTGGDGEPGYSRGRFGMIAVSGFVFVVFVAVVLLIYKRYKQSRKSRCPPAEPQIQMSKNFTQLNSESPDDEHRDKNDLKTGNGLQHSTRSDVTLTAEDELLHHPHQTAGQRP
ncbi:uncharacterized protein LOC120739199 [Simochromis diagramma]|uniref:uncharacterized protein LOC120739199 n=1 Tax=Simochromis diagramma TaxID=43689 RepID=UPI001A7E721F|nr:uncharacterized protein LOC120739199 [Simochromis diagramma]